MLQDPEWRKVLYESAGRHNITAMSDDEFVSLMAAIVWAESAGLRGEHTPYRKVVAWKSAEILANQLIRFVPEPIIDSKILFRGQEYPIDFQTEGIANVGFLTIGRLRQGLVPTADNDLYYTDIEVYSYARHFRSMPGGVPYPGLTRPQRATFGGGRWLAQGLWFAISANPCSLIAGGLVRQLVRQDQNIEYLAANLEAGAIRAGWEGVEPTAERLSWWAFRGIVKMRDVGKLRGESQDAEYQNWLDDVERTQKDARDYWREASWKIPIAMELLEEGHGGR